jgi:hypothetical protein
MLTTWHPLSANLEITSPKSGGRSVGIVRSRTQAIEFLLLVQVAKSRKLRKTVLIL